MRCPRIINMNVTCYRLCDKKYYSFLNCVLFFRFRSYVCLRGDLPDDLMISSFCTQFIAILSIVCAPRALYDCHLVSPL
jgi:hypothetical protein